MKKSDKTLVVDSLTEKIKNSHSATIVNYQGLGMKDLEALRTTLEKVGGTFSVVKNTLLKIALQNAGRIKENDEVAKAGLEGPTAVILAKDDEIAPLQSLAKIIKERDLPKLKFGIFDEKVIGSESLSALSKLPGKTVLYGQLLGSLSGPAYGLVMTLNANLQMLVHVLSQREKQLGTK